MDWIQIALSILVCLCILVFLFNYIEIGKNYPPGPLGLPILGYLPWIDAKAPHETLTNLSKKFGPIYGVKLGSVYTVVLTDPKTIKEIFSWDATTGRAPLFLTHGIMQGYGLICAEGGLWKDQRKFAFNCLRQFGASKVGGQKEKMESIIMENVQDFVNFITKMGDEGGQTVLDPLEALRHSLGSIMNQIVFGKSWSRDDEIWKWLQHLQEEGTKHIGVAGPLNFFPSAMMLPKYSNVMKFLVDGKLETHKIYQKIIEEQLQILQQQSGDFKPSNFIQAFLVERQKRQQAEDGSVEFFSDQQFYHLLADVFGAGLDTTLATLRWYLLFLATHQEIQNEIRTEVKQILQDRPPSLELLQFMPLLEASIAEAQRIRSVVPMGIPHGSLSELVVDGFVIPKGTMLVPLQWAIHMNEAVWKEPQKYDPSRFLNEEGKFRKPEGFIPFQTGKRMCVGDELARIMLLLFGCAILQNFVVDVEDGVEVDLQGEAGITLNPKAHKLVFNFKK